MARNSSPSSKRARTTKDAARRPGKKKICQFCADKATWVDYKDVNLLRRFVSDRGKIKARRVSGNCVQHQRDVAIAIKTARELALLPYSVRASSDRARGPRRSDESRGPRPAALESAEAPAEIDEAEGSFDQAEEIADGAVEALQESEA